jgi:hypothetical protein
MITFSYFKHFKKKYVVTLLATRKFSVATTLAVGENLGCNSI